MKLSEILKLAATGGFLATDKKPEDLAAAIYAADKKAKDAAGSGLGSRELEETNTPGTDREAALDEREEAMDAAEEKADKDAKAEDKAAKDRKAARDARKGARDARKGARDKAAKDRNDDPEHTNDEDYTAGSDPSTPGGSRSGGKTAIDSAEVDRRIAHAVAARDALHTAQREVEPIIGVQAFDSAGDAYRAALDHLKVDTKDIPDSALPAMLRLAKDRANATTAAPIALDKAGVSGLEKIIPGYGRLR